MMRILLTLWLCSAAFAQSGPPATSTAPAVVGILNYIHAVNSLDKTLAFYRDVFGLEAKIQPFPNPGVPALTNSPGAHLQLATLHFANAGFGLELTEFSGVDRKPGQALATDPGAAAIQIRVRDIEPVFAALKKTSATIITRSGAPLPDGNFRLLLVRDPDGYIVEAIQVPPGADAPATGNILGAAMVLSVGDMETTLKFYRDLLGFEPTGKMEFSTDQTVTDLVGSPKDVQFRHMAANVPGTGAHMEFFEFEGIPRTRFHLRVPDPGAPAMALQVRDLDGLLARMHAAGVKVTSKDGAVVQFGPTVRNIFVEDPNGVNIELFQRY
jgi:catechol 2,3-dioxygenase-like lactoylglutathione lyase family enzyme